MNDDWTWVYEGYEPGQERLRESLCTLGNGYFATRGAAPETTAGPVHYPGTYVAGCYNRLTSTVAGRQVDNEDMVNLPNWLPLRFRIAVGARWPLPSRRVVRPRRRPTLTSYEQSLDLRAGTLTRTLACASTTSGPRAAGASDPAGAHGRSPSGRCCERSSPPRAGRAELEVESGARRRRSATPVSSGTATWPAGT